MGTIQGADITALAVRMHNAQSGLQDRVQVQPAAGATASNQRAGTASKREESQASPAVVVSLSAEALARARDAVSTTEDAEARAQRQQTLDIRRFMAEQAEEGVDAMRKQYDLITDQVRIFDETGQIWMPDGKGVLQPSSIPMENWDHYGGPAAYMAIVKQRLPQYAEGIKIYAESAAEHRAFYESLLK
ncbi:hypothetical protein [Roseicella aquatilis]|uniref:Uncharacterized protein n=1 Tax=Roseicella aquatilis TaxID=2527868 RepID=A0A4R4D2N4_9PROT|nr:hypothetical protein [Roseicella aquatilis]TCZ52985.1 hypothetical protein EXY23_25520 [Roseicella aquatilis]